MQDGQDGCRMDVGREDVAGCSLQRLCNGRTHERGSNLAVIWL